MRLETMIAKAYVAKWDKINDFTVMIANQGGRDKEFYNQEKFNLSLISIDVAPLNAASFDVFMGHRWYYGNGRADMARITMTFRSNDAFDLYKVFARRFESLQVDYPYNNYLQIKVLQDVPTNEGTKLFTTFNNTIIENISQIQFSNTTENQIAEFTVTLKGIRQSIEGVEKQNVSFN